MAKRLDEFNLIRELVGEAPSHSDLLVSNGDDGAVFKSGDEILAWSCDTFVEGVHFSFDYSTPRQVGVKVVESAASDVVAMGGAPKFMLISIDTGGERELGFLKELYSGIQESCSRVGVLLIGGDTVNGGKSLSLSASVIGTVADGSCVCTRSGAKEGDSIYVTGPLGGAEIGLELLRENVPGHEELKRFHQEPRCRTDLIAQIAPIATSMVDISDGLSSELNHVALDSGVGCVIQSAQVPVVECTASLRYPTLHYALHGGEDYQLLFTAGSKHCFNRGCVEIGTVTSGSGVYLLENDEKTLLEAGGWNHFMRTTT